MTPWAWMFIGACVGWSVCAIAFMVMPTWRVKDLLRLDDEALVQLMKDAGYEWCYRHPHMREGYERAVKAGQGIAMSLEPCPYCETEPKCPKDYCDLHRMLNFGDDRA